MGETAASLPSLSRGSLTANPVTGESPAPRAAQTTAASAPAVVDATEAPRPRAPSAPASAGTARALAAPTQARGPDAAQAAGGPFQAMIQARVDTHMALANGPAGQALFRGINNALAWLGLPTVPERTDNR